MFLMSLLCLSEKHACVPERARVGVSNLDKLCEVGAHGK